MYDSYHRGLQSWRCVEWRWEWMFLIELFWTRPWQQGRKNARVEKRPSKRVLQLFTWQELLVVIGKAAKARCFKGLKDYCKLCGNPPTTTACKPGCQQTSWTASLQIWTNDCPGKEGWFFFLTLYPSMILYWQKSSPESGSSFYHKIQHCRNCQELHGTLPMTFVAAHFNTAWWYMISQNLALWNQWMW